MRNLKGLLVVISMLIGVSAMAGELIANTLPVMQCVDGKGLIASVTFNTEKGVNEVQITHKIIASGFAQPHSYILLRSATPVALKTSSGDQQVWLGRGLNLNVSVTHLNTNGGHFAYLKAILDNGQRVSEQVSCRYVGR